MKEIIVIEGTDGSGKETQTTLMLEKLKKRTKNVFLQSFPNYKNDGCEPVKQYLNGELGGLKSLTAKASSVLFAVDRLTTWKTDLAFLEDLEDYKLICDRYTTSNMIYQAAKCDAQISSFRMSDWISNLEYNEMGIPEPTKVIFLDMPVWASEELRKGRLNKITNDSKQDIHESNYDYLSAVYDISKRIALREGWIIIKCTEEERIKTIDEIHELIMKAVEVV